MFNDASADNKPMNNFTPLTNIPRVQTHQKRRAEKRRRNFYYVSLKDMSDSQEEMKVDPARAQALISQLGSVKERLAAVANGRNVCDK